jgi:hypothetical protein
MERRVRAPATLLASLAVGALFAARFHAFLLGGTLYVRDAGFFFGPWRTLLPRLASEGFPFWNPFLSNGRAYAADPNAAVFWPLSPLLFLVTPTALTLLNVALLIALFFLALRAARLGPVAAASGTAVLLFSGVLQSLPIYGGIPAAASLLAPAAVAFWAIGEGVPRRGRLVAFGGAALGLSALGGEPAISATGGLACLALTGFRIAASRPRPAASEAARRLLSALGALLLAVGLSSVQLLPAWGLLKRSARGTGLSLEHGALFWSVRPSRLLTLLEPRLTGDPNADETAGFWGAETFDAGQPYFPDLALGLVPLALAAVSARDSRGRAALGLAAGAVALSFGRFLPGYATLARPLSVFRYPEKWWLVATLALAAAAAVGVERIAGSGSAGPAEGLRSLRRSLLVLACALAAFGLLAIVSPPALRALLWRMSLGTGPAPAAGVAATLAPLLLGGAASMLLAAGLGELVRRGRAPLPALLCFILVLFLADAARRVLGTLPAGPRDLFTRESAAVELVRREATRGRFFDDGADDRATAERRTLEAGGLDPLRAATGIVFGIGYALENDIDRMTPPAAVGAVFEAERLPWGEAKLTRLRSAGVAVARTASPPPDPPGVTELGRSGGDRIVAISPTRPEFFFALEPVLAPDARAAGRVLVTAARNPLRSAVIEVPGAPEGPRAAGTGVVTVLGRSGSRVTVALTAANPIGALVMTRAYSADWTATLDGHSLPLFRADGFLTAAFVPSGQHVLELRYDDGPFVRGLIVSALSAIVAAALVLKGRFP